MSDFYKIGSKWQSKKDEKFIICICDIKPFVKPHGAYQVFGLSEYHRTEWLSHEDLEQWYTPFVEATLQTQLTAAQARIKDLETVIDRAYGAEHCYQMIAILNQERKARQERTPNHES